MAFAVEDEPCCRKPSERIVDAIAEAEDVSPIDLPPLYHTINPEAIDDAFCSLSSGYAHFVFEHCGYSVTVTADQNGDLSIEIDE